MYDTSRWAWRPKSPRTSSILRCTPLIAVGGFLLCSLACVPKQQGVATGSRVGLNDERNLISVPLSYVPSGEFDKESFPELVRRCNFTVVAITDARGVAPTELGIHREHTPPIPVVATEGSIVETTKAAISTMLTNIAHPREWMRDQGKFDLKIEISKLWVEERGVYRGDVELRAFVSADGSFEGVTPIVVQGTNVRYGRSFHPENYSETVSDALSFAIEDLLKGAELQKTLERSKPGPPGPSE